MRFGGLAFVLPAPAWAEDAGGVGPRMSRLVLTFGRGTIFLA
jgi:hypothetical protein